MKTITSVIAAVFCLTTRMVVATATIAAETTAATLPPETTLRQAFQLYHNIVSGGQLDKLETSIKKHLDDVKLGYTNYKFKDTIRAVNYDIYNKCYFLKLANTVAVQDTTQLTDAQLFSFFNDLIHLIFNLSRPLSTPPRRVKDLVRIKEWLISIKAASSDAEFDHRLDKDTPYFCFNALLRNPGNLVKLIKLFDDYTTEKAKIEAAAKPRAEEASGTDNTNATHTQVIPQPGNATETSSNGPPSTPAPSTPASPATPEPSASNASDSTSTEGPTAPTETTSPSVTVDVITPNPAPSTPASPATPEPSASNASDSTSTEEPASSTAPIPSADGATSVSPSTPAPAQPAETVTTDRTAAATVATGETTQQEAPQVENLKPAPTGSSASFNGLAVAVLSVLVVSSM